MIRRLIFACLLLVGSLYAQTNYYVNAATGNDSRTAVQAQNPATPWLTIQHANKRTLSNACPGAIVNVASGTYNGNIITSQTGTSACRIRYQSTTQYGARLVGTAGGGIIWEVAGGFTDVVGFDFDGSVNAAEVQGLVIDRTAPHVNAIQNRFHDIASGGGSTQTAILSSTSAGQNSSGFNLFDGNLIYHNNGGSGHASSSGAANTGITTGINDTAQNNIVMDQGGGWCIQATHSSSNVIVTNNTMLNCDRGGLIIDNENGSTNDFSTFTNNIIANSGAFGGSSGLRVFSGGCGAHNLYANNLAYGNSPQNYEFDSCSSVATGQQTGTNTSIFTNYTGTITGTYTLKSTSPAIGTGISTCASGVTGCVPPVDFARVARPSGGAQSIGAYVFTSAGVPIVAFSPSPVAFGTIAVSGTGTATLTLTNNGSANLTFSAASISGTNAADFHIVSTTCSSPLAAGAPCTYSLSFIPSASGARSANLTLADNAAGSPHQVPLTGTGGSVAVTFNPTSVNFGVVAPGSCSANQPINITSTGSSNLTISAAFALTGTNPGDFQKGAASDCSIGQSLAPGQSCTGTVRGCPTVVGSRSANFSVSDNAPGSPQAVPLTVTGGAAVASLSPSSGSCGSQQIGTSNTCQAFTLTNTGNLNLTGIVPSFTGATPAAYSQSNNCPANQILAPTASCVITAFFKPIAAGAQNATLQVTSNASPATATLTGTGVSPPTITLGPQTVNFNSVLVGNFSPVTNITVTNNGGSSVTLSSISLTGSNPGDFTAGECSTSTTGFTDNFDQGSLSSIWQIDTGPAPGTIPGVNTGTFSTANVDITTWRMLGLKVTQASAAPVISVGAEIRAVNPLGFGTYRWNMKAASTATNPFTAGSAVSGQITSNFILNSSVSNPYTEIDAPEIEGQTPNTLEWTTWTTPSLNTGVPTTLANPEAAFHVYGFKWIAASVAFQVDGSVVATNTTHIPTAVANPMINLWGTNSTGFGGLATTGTVRWMWVKGFAFTPSGVTSLAAGTSCTIPVYFSPQSTGTKNATLSIADTAAGSPHQASVSGTGTAPLTSLLPASFAFPTTQPVGTQTAPQNFTLANTGTGPMTFAISLAGTDAAQFALGATACISPLAAGQSCLIPVSFKPTATGAKTATLQVVDSASGSPHTSALTGTAIATAPAVCLSVTSINFSNQPVGTSSGSRPTTVTNCGTANLVISAITPTGNFSQTNNCTTVAPGLTCTIQGTFSPLSAGTLTGNFSIASNAGSSPDVISLSGFGTQTGATLTSTASFGHVTVGVSSSPIQLTLTNTGNTSLSLLTPTITGSNASDFSFGTACGASLAPNATCLLSVVFTPSNTGSRTATLTQPFANGVASVTSALSGTGDAPASAICLAPTVVQGIDFGNVSTGVASGAKTEQITSCGAATLNISGITLTGTNAGDYADTSQCPAALPAGQSCAVSITVTPGGLGARTANLHIVDDSPTSPENVPLTVNGVASPTPKISLSPASLSFSPPSIQTGTTSQGLTITGTNTGNANLTVTHPVTLGSSNPGDFTISDNCGTVTPGNSCTATVNCVPTVAGSRSATAIFTSNAASSPDSVPVSCTGFVGTPNIVLAVSSINFNNCTVGTVCGPAVFTLTNTGLATATSVVISASGDFSVTDNCGGSITAGSSCSASVRFSPIVLCGDAGCTTDVHSGQVTVVSNTANSPQTVSLQGTAVPTPPPPGPFRWLWEAILWLAGILS